MSKLKKNETETEGNIIRQLSFAIEMEYVVEWQNCELWEYVHTSQKGKTENWHYLEINIYCTNQTQNIGRY